MNADPPSRMSQRVTIGLSVGTSPPVRRIRAMLAAARVLRYDVAWTVDHFQGFVPQEIWDRELAFTADPSGTPHAFFDYQALLGSLAARAGRVRLGVGVTETIRRHPVLVAQWAMTMSHLTRTAPILGVGAGEAENTEPYGLSRARPVARLEEALQIVRRCFESRGPIDFAGEFFTLDGAVLDLAPAQDRVPRIWVAAHGPRMLELTGRYGDGWYPTLPYTPQGYADALAVVRVHARSVGRDAEAIVPAWSGLVVLGRTEAEARRLLDRRLIRFIALLAPDDLWRRHGATHPLGEGFGGLIEFIPQRYSRPQLEAAMAAVPIELAAETLLWGTPATVENAVGDLIDAGLRHVVLHPASASASPRDAAYSLWHTSRILRRLRRRQLAERPFG